MTFRELKNKQIKNKETSFIKIGTPYASSHIQTERNSWDKARFGVSGVCHVKMCKSILT